MIGLRKVIGSYRSDLIKQFLTDSTLTTLLATILGLVLAWLLLPWFNILSGKGLTIPVDEWMFLPALFIFILLIGLISRAYPAFYLSSFKPIEVLKGELSRGAKTSRLRGVMVVFQFACSFILIVGALVVYRQMQLLFFTYEVWLHADHLFVYKLQ